MRNPRLDAAGDGKARLFDHRMHASMRAACVWAGLAVAPIAIAAAAEAPKSPVATASASAAKDVIVYVSELPKSAFSEFRVVKDEASPGAMMTFTPNAGGDLDPPPENDPHVIFKVKVQPGIAYRPWLHMKVGKPKGKSTANKVFLQFSQAVDKANREILKPKTASYQTLTGPARVGWVWVGGESKENGPLIYFRGAEEVTVRIQGGMEGVGFDQFVLSPARFLEGPPTEAVLKK